MARNLLLKGSAHYRALNHKLLESWTESEEIAAEKDFKLLVRRIKRHRKDWLPELDRCKTQKSLIASLQQYILQTSLRDESESSLFAAAERLAGRCKTQAQTNNFLLAAHAQALEEITTPRVRSRSRQRA
jgi:hypothetical protein